eukprot:13772787-Alexandrium_andersonii.AAC.1
MPPVGLGSGRSDLAHETHAMYHAWYLETGSAELLARVGAAVVAVTSDKGTESNLAGHSPVPFEEF